MTFRITEVKSSLPTRLASKEMQLLFSDRFKVQTWRRLWVNLAEVEKELGLAITDEQIEEMKSKIDKIDLSESAEEEESSKNEVVAQVYVFAKQCPKAAKIINYGVTSYFISDNADLIILRDALDLLLKKIVNVVKAMSDFALKYADLPTLGSTHLQPAQLTTVGRRAAMWINDLLMDESNLSNVRTNLKFLGVKGATGTQTSLLDLFGGDSSKVKDLDKRITELCGFEKHFLVTGQTYSRKVDLDIVSATASLGATIHKVCLDLRLLNSLREVDEAEEPAAKGTLVMPFKKTSDQSERCCSLARHLITLHSNAANTHAVQCLERSFDDSINRKMTLSESFLTADACLVTMLSLVQGLGVNEKIIEKHISQELPFMAAGTIVEAMVKTGADRATCQKNLQNLIFQAASAMHDGHDNDLLKRIKKDSFFSAMVDEPNSLLDAKSFTGRAAEQVQEFYDEVVVPVIKKYGEKIGKKSVKLSKPCVYKFEYSDETISLEKKQI